MNSARLVRLGLRVHVLAGGTPAPLTETIGMPEWELLPKEPAPQQDASRPTEIPPRIEPTQARYRNKRLLLAFTVAAISDVVAVWITLLPPLQWLLDIVTAFLLFLILGRQWMILPGLIAEAIPGIAIFPFWVLVVTSIAVWGKISKPPNGSPRP
jgi:hypothetical protein